MFNFRLPGGLLNSPSATPPSGNPGDFAAATDRVPYMLGKSLQVADPDFIQLVTLPPNGDLTFGATCGAAVAFKTSTDPLSDDLSALVKAIGTGDAAAKR